MMWLTDGQRLLYKANQNPHCVFSKQHDVIDIDIFQPRGHFDEEVVRPRRWSGVLLGCSSNQRHALGLLWKFNA